MSATDRTSISRDTQLQIHSRATAPISKRTRPDPAGSRAVYRSLAPQHRSSVYCMYCSSLHVPQFSQGALVLPVSPRRSQSKYRRFFFFLPYRMKATTALLARANQLIAFRHGRLNAGACEIPLYDSDLLAHRAPARPAPRARARRTMRPVAARDAERCALSPREAPSGAYQIGLTGCLDAGMCVCERACARLCDAEER